MKRKKKVKRKVIALSMALSMACTLLPAQSVLAKKTSDAKIATQSISAADGLTITQINDESTFYAVDIQKDYPLSDLLCENIYSAEDLTAWLNSRLGEVRKPLLDVNMGDGGACSAFVTKDENGNLIYARNYDYLQEAQNALVHTNPSDGYESVSMAAGGWVTPAGKTLDSNKAYAYALPYLAMDGMNEKGVMISVLKLDGDGARQKDASKSAIIPNILVRLVLDRADSVDSAVALMDEYNVCSSMDYANFHYFIADATGTSAIVEVNPSDGSVTVDKGNVKDDSLSHTNRQITNFYQLYQSKDYNLDDGLHGLDRYMKFVRQLENCDYTMSKEGAMALLEEAYQDNTMDETHETQWSVIYTPADMSVNVSTRYDASDDKDIFYSRQYNFDVSGMGNGSVNLSPDRKEGTESRQASNTGEFTDGERKFQVAANERTERAGGQVISDITIDQMTGEWTEAQIIQTLKDAGEDADLFRITYETGDDTAVVTSDAGSTKFVKFDGTLQNLMNSVNEDAGSRFMIQAMGDIKVASDAENAETGTVSGNDKSVVLQMNGHLLYADNGSADFTMALNHLHLAVYMDSALKDAGISRIQLGEGGYIVCNADTSNGLKEIVSGWDQSMIGYGVWKNVDKIAVGKIIGGHFYNTQDKATQLNVNTITGGTFGQKSSQNNAPYPLVVNGEIKSGSFLDSLTLEMETGKIENGTFACEVILGNAQITDGVFKNVVTAQFNGDTRDGSSLGQSMISGGKFRKTVINRGVITGGVFVDTLQNDVAATTDYDGNAIAGGNGGEITGGVFKDKENITGTQPQTLTFRKLRIERGSIPGTELKGTVTNVLSLDVIPGTEVTMKAETSRGNRFLYWIASMRQQMKMEDLLSATTTLTMPDYDGKMSVIENGDERSDYEITLAPEEINFGEVRIDGELPERVIAFKNIGKKHFASWKWESREEFQAFDIRVELDNDDGAMYRNTVGKIYVRPKPGLDVCAYADAIRLIFYDENGEEVDREEMNLFVQFIDYGIRVKESYLHFGQVEDGSGEWPEAQELHLTNKGVEKLSGWQLTSDAETSAFTFSQTTGDIEAGDTVTVSVRPKEGLPVGVYEEIFAITYGEDTKVSVPVYFEVKAKKTVCQGKKEVKLSEGTHQMTLGDKEAGTYTFAGSGDKWSIQNADGKYIGFKDNVLTYEEEPFQWIYKNNMFYTTVNEKQSGNRGWWFWGGWNQDKTVNWFLNATDENGLTVSKNEAKAKFYDTITSQQHSFGEWESDGSGNHNRVCEVCGAKESGACSYDENTHKCSVCGATDPANTSVHVDVKVTKKTGSSGGWWFWSRPSKTTWTAAITVTGEGVDIDKVEYSTDQKTYKTGTSFTSENEILIFYIRVTDANGNVTNWIYENGVTTQI